MYLVAGLGNPGKEYQMTRHNIGFESMDYLADVYNIKMNKLKFKAVLGEGVIGGEKVIFAKPQTYMNLSGESIREIVSFYKIAPEHVIIIYDDVDLAVGKIRIRPHGSAGGHNGMKSILYQLQTDQFPRVRLGIGKADIPLADYVLGRFGKEEIPVLRETIQKLEDAIRVIIQEGPQAAMNRFNG